MSNTLTEIAKRLCLDKGTAPTETMPWHAAFPDHRTMGYTTIYEHYMEPLRHAPCRLLEVGVCDQRFPLGSLKMWREYAPEWRLTAMDFFVGHARGQEAFYAEQIANMGIHLTIGDQARTETYSRLPNEPFNFIIEDGSHIEAHMLFSLQMLLPRLSVGGFYFMEDIDAKAPTTAAFLDKLEEFPELVKIWLSPCKLSYLAVFQRR